MFHDIFMRKRIFWRRIFVPEYGLHETDHFSAAYLTHRSPGVFAKRYFIFKNIN